MYGKSLSIPDDLIFTYFELLTDVSNEELDEIKTKIAQDPRNAKHDLAHQIVKQYHGGQAADDARTHFENTVINKQVPDDAPEFIFTKGEHRLLDLINETALAPSNAEAKRMIKQGGVSVDDEKITDMNHSVIIGDEDVILKVGKRKYGILKGE